MFGVVILPALAGTALVILTYLPMRGDFMAARAAEGSAWIFAAAGALIKRDNPGEAHRPMLWWPDCAAALLAVLVVRVMERGIPFGP